MKQTGVVLAVGLFLLVMGLEGCAVRTYTERKDRVDQELSPGNRGYLQGSRPAGEEVERPTTRQVYVAEVEVGPKVKTPKKAPQVQPTTSDKEIWGNQGYMEESEGSAPEISSQEASSVSMEKYTVQKSDTLQKISQKFFGTTKKWYKIYEANKDVLKSPDKIYPGQVINIPVEGTTLKEPQENLK